MTSAEGWMERNPRQCALAKTVAAGVGLLSTAAILVAMLVYVPCGAVAPA